jgi:hypothetical protein
MSSVLYGRGTYRQGDALRQRTAMVTREIGDLADDMADLRAAVAEMNKVLVATVARLDALEKAIATGPIPSHSAPTSQ